MDETRLRSTRMPNLPLNFEGAAQRGVKLIATRLDRVYSDSTRLQTSGFLIRRARPVEIWRLGSVTVHNLTCATWHVGNGGEPMARPWTAPRVFCARVLEDGARALIVDGPPEPAHGRRTLFFTHRMRSGSCWRRNKNPRHGVGPYFFTHWMRPGSCWRRNKNPPIVARPYLFTHRMRPGSCCLGK